MASAAAWATQPDIAFACFLCQAVTAVQAHHSIASLYAVSLATGIGIRRAIVGIGMWTGQCSRLCSSVPIPPVSTEPFSGNTDGGTVRGTAVSAQEQREEVDLHRSEEYRAPSQLPVYAGSEA
ncbi:hypothetical protein GY45DRAFT_27396 [Cubamyces sp. BRFM 1775]|nr:hypothetical protein GY45DRAFT_27396 [Cubamyces sp. BRFM 1775]